MGLFALTALVCFAVGFTSYTSCISDRTPAVPPVVWTSDCTPLYDATFVRERLHEEDDPKLFAEFQEPPLYTLPDCVDEAYSLIWIPSFHPPVMVRLWRSGDRAFMVAKKLDSNKWSSSNTIQETNFRALTPYEWRAFTDLLDHSSFWELPSTIDEVEPDDGAVWLINGLRGKQFSWVRRRVPNEQFADISKNLIRLSGLETAHALYLP